jgi:hypothetical protein
MWNPRRLTTLWATTASYRDTFTLLYFFTCYVFCYKIALRTDLLLSSVLGKTSLPCKKTYCCGEQTNAFNSVYRRVSKSEKKHEMAAILLKGTFSLYFRIHICRNTFHNTHLGRSSLCYILLRIAGWLCPSVNVMSSWSFTSSQRVYSVAVWFQSVWRATIGAGLA